MKTKTLCIAVSVLMAMMILSDATAQLGMDYETTSGLTRYYSKLRRVSGTQTNRNQKNEKALGVYSEIVLPQSAFEVNTNFTHMPNYLTLWYNRGNVFRTAAPTGFTQQWQMFRDNTQMARLFNTLGTENVTLEASLNGHLFFNTNSITRTRLNGTLTTTINSVNQNVSGYFGIGPSGYFAANSPMSMLHLEGPNNTPWLGDGWRRWMNTGVFMKENSDAMYIGLKQEGFNRSDAVINWSDDAGDDNLRIVFTNIASGNGTCTNCPRNSAGLDGMEIARFTPTGRTGIGPDFTATLPPRRRLDILTDFQASPTQGEPQLRLTFAQNQSLSNGIYTDFQTTFNGDMAILPFNSNLSAGLQPRNVGIRTNTPRRRLDIFDDGAGTFFIGRPQLRLTQADNATINVYTDFQTTLLGDLFINPAFLNISTNTLTPRNIGIQTIFPQNTLEINSPLVNSGGGSGATVDNGNPAVSPYTGNATGWAGLRFTDLTNASIPEPNDSNKVLSVNADGDVILVNDGGGGGGIGLCTAPVASTNLTGNSRVGLNNFKLFFDGNGISNANQIGVGYQCGSLLWAKLDVFQNSYTTLPFGATKYAIAISGNASSPSASFSVGVYGSASSTTGQNAGIYGYAPFGSNNFAGYFSGDIYGTGISIATGNLIQSDGMLKTDTSSFTSGLEIIRNIHTVSFRYNGMAGLDSTKTHIGAIAENVAQIAPYAVDTFFAKLDSVDTNTTALLAIKTEAIIYTTINAVKELDSTVTTLLPPPPTTLISPANGDTGLPIFTEITLVWNSAPNANAYIVNIISSADPKAGTRSFTTSDTTYGFFTKFCNATYNWWVVTENNNGKSDKSEVWSFTTTGPGTAIPPALVSPNNGDTTTLGVQFSWSPVSNTESYSLFLSASPNDAELISTYWASDTIINANLPFDNFTYYWWIKSWNCSGESVASEIRSFYARSYVTPPPPEYPSDSAYKLNVSPIDSALEKVMLLNGVNFDWNRTQFPQMHFDSTRTLGFIAQQVRPVVPEIVHQNDTGALSVDYGRLSALLTEAIKQQQQTILFLSGKVDSLASLINQQQNAVDSVQSAQIATMQYCIDNLPPGMGCNDSLARKANPDSERGNEREIQKLVLESSASAILYQNEPNPFGNSTIIRYYVPESSNEALLIFYDEFGREIIKESLKHKGYAYIDIIAEKLAAGIYNYSLIVDGKVTDTKKMVRSK